MIYKPLFYNDGILLVEKSIHRDLESGFDNPKEVIPLVVENVFDRNKPKEVTINYRNGRIKTNDKHTHIIQ